MSEAIALFLSKEARRKYSKDGLRGREKQGIRKLTLYVTKIAIVSLKALAVLVSKKGTWYMSPS